MGNLDFYFNPFSAHKTSHDVPENFQLDYLMPHAFLLEFRYSVPSGVKQITPNKHFWHAKPFGKGGSLEKNLNLQYTLVGRKRVKIDQDFFIRERGQIDQDFFASPILCRDFTLSMMQRFLNSLFTQFYLSKVKSVYPVNVLYSTL